METPPDRQSRKHAAKLEKRKRIEESGGIRPREGKHENAQKKKKPKGASTVMKVTYFEKGGKGKKSERGGDQHADPQAATSGKDQQRHRFGRVMASVPSPNKPRTYTLSIAVPGSVVDNCQTRELKTYLVGQIARAATIYHVDEVIVFNDNLGSKHNDVGSHYLHRRGGYGEEKSKSAENEEVSTAPVVKSDSHSFMAKILQYCECPQYLRRHFFPMHLDLQFAGLLSPLDAPHHVRVNERSKYREGVVLDKRPGPNGGSYVNAGIKDKPVEIDRVLAPGIRCTVKLDPKAYDNPRNVTGEVVSPAAPREDDGTYWGYSTRLANSIKEVFEECPYEMGYDLKVGTSERGDVSVDSAKFSLPKFKHMLIVFGGVAGIEEVSVARRQ